MNFLLQKGSGVLDLDIEILRQELIKQRWNHKYRDVKLCYMDEFDNLDDWIPVGTIEFLKTWLKLTKGINQMNPIEIPIVLRTDEFLKRDYKIIPKDQLPMRGYYFTKYVSELKYFTHIGEIESLHFCDPNKEPLLKKGLYQLSEVVDIQAEYRIFVHHDKIVAINYYDGHPDIFPDTSLIKKAISMYMQDETRPKAYTMDVIVIKDRGTALLEIHPWVSVGLYGYMFGSCLPYCYRDGLDWYIEHNTTLEVYK